MILLLEVESGQGPAHVASMTRDIRDTLQNQIGLRTDPVTRPANAGERSAEVEVLGQLAIAFLGGGGAGSALVGCLRSYLARDRSAAFRLRRPDGLEVELAGPDLDPGLIHRLLDEVSGSGEGGTAGG